jgi:ABC-type iron transport system FetAB ATPase subunit
MLKTRSLSRLHIGPVDLDLDAGTCTSIAGKSGAGKSVLLRMIADLDPHEGDCALDGQACSAMAAPKWRRQVKYVAAESGWWDKTVAAHFAPGADCASLLPALGIAGEAAQWPVERLSTGERQRLALLRALTPATRVLLLDEPTSGLDQASVAQVEALLRERMAAGVTILMVTHDAAQAGRMASRHFELRDGKLLQVAAAPPAAAAPAAGAQA